MDTSTQGFFILFRRSEHLWWLGLERGCASMRDALLAN